MHPAKKPWDNSRTPPSRSSLVSSPFNPAPTATAPVGPDRAALNRRLKASIEAVNQKRAARRADPVTPTTPRGKPFAASNDGGVFERRGAGGADDGMLSPREMTVLRELSALLAEASAPSPLDPSRLTRAKAITSTSTSTSNVTHLHSALDGGQEQHRRPRAQGEGDRDRHRRGGHLSPAGPSSGHRHPERRGPGAEDGKGRGRGVNDVAFAFADNSVAALRAVLDEARELVREKDAQLVNAGTRVGALEAELAQAMEAVGRDRERATRAERRAAALERALGIVHGNVNDREAVTGATGGAGEVVPARVKDSIGPENVSVTAPARDRPRVASPVANTEGSPSSLHAWLGSEEKTAGAAAAGGAISLSPMGRRGSEVTPLTSAMVNLEVLDEEVKSSAAAVAAAESALACPTLEVETVLAEALRAARQREREMLRHLEGAADDLAAAERDLAVARAAAEAERARRTVAEQESVDARTKAGVLHARLSSGSQSHRSDTVITSTSCPMVYPVTPSFAVGARQVDEAPGSRPRMGVPPPTPALAREFLLQKKCPPPHAYAQTTTPTQHQQWHHHQQLPRDQLGARPLPCPSPELVSLLDKARLRHPTADDKKE